MAYCSGENKPALSGMPKEACWSFSHIPSPLSIFFSKIGTCLDTSGDGEMECIPCNMALDIHFKFDGCVLFVAAMKLLTNTFSSMTASAGESAGSG
eukprot:3344849-Ditylum_brightwellii.AAC.1